MNSVTTGELRNPGASARAKYAVRTAIVLVVAFTSTLGLYAYLAVLNGIWQYSLLSGITAVTLILNILALRYGVKKQTERAAYSMIAGILLLFPFATALLSGVGLVLGIGALIGIYMIASLTLVQPQLSRVIIVGIVYSVALIVFDLFFPFSRIVNNLLIVYIPVVAVVGIGVFTYYISQEFSNYPFRTKLIIFFVLVAVFSAGAVAIFNNVQARRQIAQLVGQNQQNLAERLAYETGVNLDVQVENLQAVSFQLESVANRKSSFYEGENSEITRGLLETDRFWRSATDDSTLVQGVLANITARDLKKFQRRFPAHVEIFLTDKYGGLIASTNRTSDFYQADEDWWKIAYSLGKGKVYISQPEFDESSNTYAILVAIPVSYNGKIVGVLRSTYDVSALIANLREGSTDQSVEVDLRIAGDVLMTGDVISPIEQPGLSRVTGSFGEIMYKGEPSLVSQQRVFSSKNSESRDAVDQLGWSVIVHQDLDNALQPVQAQTRVITLTAVIIAIIVGLLGFFASQRFADPILTLTEVTRRVAGGDLSIRAQIATQDEVGDLANSFNRMTSQLQDTLNGLERRVAERTTDLEFSRLVSERRAQELQVISEVSRTISTEQRLEILLPLVTRLVSERFDFYHVGIFFIDETKQYTVLQAANSEGGRIMLARGHRLNLGAGIVGTVAQTGKPRIALDVGSDAIFFDNPDLPETRSEMALPLNFRGETIGVLDVQSVKPGAFSESDASTLSILADQVAIAIENARLFGQSLRAREETEALYNQFLRAEWRTFLQQEPSVGYRQSMVGGKPLKHPVETDEIRNALNNGKVVVIDKQDPKSLPAVAIPVQLRGQTIGVINIKAPSKTRVWSQEEINLAQAISDRLALALDGARLLQDSQRRAAKEAKIGEMTAKIGASINMRNVLQTAVEELGRALPGSEVIIQFESNTDHDEK